MTKVKLPKKSQVLFNRMLRYIIFHGGRGSAKSWSVARVLVLMTSSQKLRVLCAREIQKSIKESVHQLLCDQIAALGLEAQFTITDNSIVHMNGSQFIFSGLKTNITAIKSMEGIDIVWVEEAEKVSKNSWEKLIPTIRKPGSQIWVTFNPDDEKDPTSSFILNPPPNSKVVEMNWRDNPWFPPELRAEMEYMKRVDPDAADNVWEGKFRRNSKAMIFANKWIVDSFKPGADWNGPYDGADWGFSQDPNTLLRVWIAPSRYWNKELTGKSIYIEYEAYGLGVELNDIPSLWQGGKSQDGVREWSGIPDIKDAIIRADNSRPETISHLCSLGFNVMAATKWSGSVEDGIEFLRSFEKIVIHTRCKHTQEEARLYKFKVDPLTGDVTTVIVDKHNHCWDAIRYALDPMIVSGDYFENMNLGEDVVIDQTMADYEMDSQISYGI